MECIVRLRGVYKSYRLGETTVPALQGVDFEVRPGEFTSVVGASGSGKTTLLNLIGCLDVPDRGSIHIGSRETTALSERALSELRNESIGFIFQSFNLVPVLSVSENVELPLLVSAKLSLQERRARVDEMLSAVELSAYAHHKPDQLSGGQRQRVAIARALVNRPALVLADEPTANLDSKTAHRILDLMAELNRSRNVTFLFCSHDEKLMSRVSRVARIEDGVIAG